jgi:hypothetical protein
MMGESKFDVMGLVPKELQPKAAFIKLPSALNDIKLAMSKAGLRYPVIFKPDLGERGWMVRKIHHDLEAAQYLTEIKIDFIVQDFVDLPLEFGVYYVRNPKDENGRVISITAKEMLAVTGNGKDTLAQLVWSHDRAKLQYERLNQIFLKDWHQPIALGETVVLNSIGNHCLGTKFLNGNDLITQRMNAAFDVISKKIKGFYFGRYDLRCATLADLENGQVLIMELNGCGAEPAHIYHPGFSLWKAIGVLSRHWRTMYEVSVENHRRGAPYLSFAEGIASYKRARAILGKS